MTRTQSVSFVGLDDLKIDDYDTASIKTTAQRGLEKIKEIIQQDASLKVHIKRYFAAKENKQHKYSVVLHLEYSGNQISIEGTSDWDLKKAVKMAINGLESRISRIFKTQGAKARYSAESSDKDWVYWFPAV